MGGPGWNPVGTGGAGAVLVGASDLQLGGIYMDASGECGRRCVGSRTLGESVRGYGKWNHGD